MSDPQSSPNHAVAERLREMADLLAAQGANPFRVSAYRKAADEIAQLPRDLRELFEQESTDGLEAIPGVGKGIAAAIAELLVTGRWSQLERLRGAVDPVQLFQTIPGIGEDLARRIHDTLDVDTLEALEIAAHDGRLETVPGIGPRRAAMLRASLSAMLDRVRRRPLAPRERLGEPPVGLLLAVDREYRVGAEAGALPTIAPKRFNPGGEAWLPILHAEREGWHFTALYSNTARAHELDRVRDWVVIYFYDGGEHVEGQRTVVTETHGALTGQRVVRGRERECRELAAERPDKADVAVTPGRSG
ncbi:MAG TPA: helix-hairpin-helix domain-containing protein [Pelomicrobium sp.]|nr:helix-hairpin-helix domain-containing protein [Pelomicrobium sp.]